MEICERCELSDFVRDVLEPILGDIETREGREPPDLRRQMHQLVVVQPQLVQRRKTADVRRQLINFIVSQIESLELLKLRQRFRQDSDEVLAKLQRRQVIQTSEVIGQIRQRHVVETEDGQVLQVHKTARKLWNRIGRKVGYLQRFAALNVFGDVGNIVSRYIQLDEVFEVLNVRRYSLYLVITEAELPKSIETKKSSLAGPAGGWRRAAVPRDFAGSA